MSTPAPAWAYQERIKDFANSSVMDLNDATRERLLNIVETQPEITLVSQAWHLISLEHQANINYAHELFTSIPGDQIP